jgi:hypothetical protein
MFCPLKILFDYLHPKGIFDYYLITSQRLYTVNPEKERLPLKNVGDRLLVKLPIHPSTIEELALIRFWLLKLSQTHFKELYAKHGILNPELLSVLNPRTGPRKILFHANFVRVGEHKTAISADVVQFLCARQMTLYTSNLDQPCQNNLFNFIMGTGNTLKYFRIYSKESNHEEFCEFLVKVNFFKFVFIIPNFL